MIRNHMVATCSEVYNESIIKSLTSLSEESVYSTIYEFNRIINDYNSRCGRYQYQQGSQSRAEHDVEPYRNQIEYEAIQTAKQLNNAYNSSYSNMAINAAPKSKSQRVSNQQIGEVQKLLYKLGYNPGPIDGQYGVQTASAIKNFQLSMGLAVNGRVNLPYRQYLMYSAI